MTIPQIWTKSEKLDHSVLKAYNPVCLYLSNHFEHKSCCVCVQYLRFKVPVHHTHIVHMTDCRHQFPHDATGLCFTEMLLSADPLQQLPSTEQLQNQERVELQQNTHTNTQHILTLFTKLYSCLTINLWYPHKSFLQPGDYVWSSWILRTCKMLEDNFCWIINMEQEKIMLRSNHNGIEWKWKGLNKIGRE